MHAIRRNKVNVRSAVFVLIAIAVVLLAGREVMARDVVYVIPDGFTGFVNVVESATAEETLSPTLQGLVVKIPASGRLEVRSIEPLRKWSVVTAHFVSGKPLEVFNPSIHKANDFGFWMMGVPAGDRLYAFVGTQEEMRMFVEDHGERIFRAPPLDP